MRIVVSSVGFFPWVVEREVVHACSVDTPLWSHDHTLRVPVAAVQDPTPDVFVWDGDTLVASIDTWIPSFDLKPVVPSPTPVALKNTPLGPAGTPIGGDWTGLQMVACLDDLAIGAVLAPDWPTRPGFRWAIDLPGGALSTTPDDRTRTRVFIWQGRWTTRRQPSTELVRYESLDYEHAEIVFRRADEGQPTPGGPTERRFALRPIGDGSEQVPITILSCPDPEPVSEADARRLDLAHMLASLALCEIPAGQDVALRLHLTEQPLGSTQAGSHPAGCHVASIQAFGRPNCGPRWVFAEGTRPEWL